MTTEAATSSNPESGPPTPGGDAPATMPADQGAEARVTDSGPETLASGQPSASGSDAEAIIPGLVVDESARRRRPRWAKVLITMGVVLVLFAVGSVISVRLLINRYDNAVPKANLLDPDARASQSTDGGGLPGLPIDSIHGPLNFLLLGSDLRDDDPDGGERSDTIILLHIPASLDRAYLISIPRDLRVHIPADETTGFKGSHSKINGAFNFGGGGVGGFQLLSRTLKNLIGINFDGAAIINFDGFQAAVNLLGGVTMCVDHRTRSIHTGAVYEVGCQHMQPWQALDYVRQRKSLPNGDYDRQRHQQQFLKAVFQEAIDQGIITNPLKLDQFIRQVGGALTVDTNGVKLSSLVFGLRDIRPSSIVGIRLPSHPKMISGISYVIADDEATSLYQAIADDSLDTWVTDNPTWINQTDETPGSSGTPSSGAPASDAPMAGASASAGP